MRFGGFSGLAALGIALVALAPLGAGTAEARARSAGTHGAARSYAGYSASHNVRAIQAGMAGARTSYARHGYSVARYGRGGLQCVPFARENSGIELSGNAATWWNAAEGVYERGARPEVGSVLNFRANGRMRMGHVAVVANVLDSRNVEIDHANWAGPGASRGGISRNITVVDVSERNDWTAVRVALGHTGDYGSVYPTYGFIYDRPDKGTMVANAGRTPGAITALNTPPRDLRPAAERYQAAENDIVEVAEAEDDAQPRMRRVSRRGDTGARVKGIRMVSGHGMSMVEARSSRGTSGHASVRTASARAGSGHGSAHATARATVSRVAGGGATIAGPSRHRHRA